MLEFEKSIPIEELWTQLSFTKKLKPGSLGWAQAAKLRQSLILVSESDGLVIARALEQQEKAGTLFPLDTADLRHIGQRTVMRTEAGEVEVRQARERARVPRPAGDGPRHR
jgi:hypothetical protein